MFYNAYDTQCYVKTLPKIVLISQLLYTLPDIIVMVGIL